MALINNGCFSFFCAVVAFLNSDFQEKGDTFFNMKKSLFLTLLLFILPLFSCSALSHEKYTADVPKCHCLPVFPDKDGWYGGDSAYSIQLDEQRTLWLFGDTFVADEAGRKDRIDMDVILGTTLAISTCSDDGEFAIQYYLKKENKKVVSSFGEDDKKWIAVYLSIENKGDQLFYQYADQPEGPWSKPKSLDVDIPEVDPQSPLYDKNTFCYAGKEHIEFAGNGNRIVTYVCNSAEDDDEASFIRSHLFLYRPVVVQVPCCE